MCAVAVEDFDAGSQRNLFAKHLDRRSLLDDPSAESMLGLKPYNKDCVSRIAGAVQEVVNDPSRFRHSRSGDDDERSPQRVQRLRLFDLPGVPHQVEPEEVVDALDQVFASIEAVRMHFKDARHVGRERAVDEDRNTRDSPFLEQAVKVVQDFLHATNSKSRYEHATAARRCLAYDRRESRTGIFGWSVIAVSIRRLHDHGVRTFGYHGIANDRQSPPPDVSRENEPPLHATFVAVEQH